MMAIAPSTIRRPEKHDGDEIIAFFKIENGILTLAGVRSPESYEPEWPTSVETAESRMDGRYELRKVQATSAGGPVSEE